MLDNNKIQYIGKIENSNNVVIINGNLTIDGQISKDLQTSCLEILRTDFDKYTTTAIAVSYTHLTLPTILLV